MGAASSMTRMEGESGGEFAALATGELGAMMLIKLGDLGASSSKAAGEGGAAVSAALHASIIEAGFVEAGDTGPHEPSWGQPACSLAESSTSNMTWPN